MSLEDLRRAFRELTPPEVGGDIEREPAELRELVSRLRAEWLEMDTRTANSTVFAASASLRHRRRLTRRWLRRAGIAALLAASVWPASVFLRDVSDSGSSATVGGGSGGRGSGVVGQRSSEGSASRVETIEHDPRPMVPARPQVLVATEERVEMRSGAVRLVLVRPSIPPDIDPDKPN